MHIFISYAKVDARDLAKMIFTRLNSMDGVSAWMDTSLVPAQSWAQQIQEELDRSDLVVVVLTPDVNRPKTEGQSTSFVLKEINYAQSLHKPVLPVMGNYTHLPVQIADLEYIDFSRSIDEGMNRLVDYILNLTGADAPRPQPWQEETVDSGARPVLSPPSYTPIPPRPASLQSQRKQKKGNPLVGLLSGALSGCVVGGIMLVVAAWAIFTFVLNDDTISDADATATAEVELTASASVTESMTAARTPTRTVVPLATNTQPRFVPTSTPRPFVPTNTSRPTATRTIVVPTATWIVPTNTWVVPTSTIAVMTATSYQPPPTIAPTPTPAPQ